MNDRVPLQDILTRVDDAAVEIRPGVEAFIADVAKVMPTLEEMTPRLVALFRRLTVLASTPEQHFFIALFAVNGYSGCDVSIVSRSRGSEILEGYWNLNSGIRKLQVPALMYARTLFAHLKNHPESCPPKAREETLAKLLEILPESEW